jgi:ABC-type transport system involved in multi-copper enzyme maturation permease subunit
MTQLPIVSRELRVAARKASTFWVRLVAVLVASVIAAGFMLLTVIGFPGGPRFGPALFSTLTWLAFVATSLAGVFLTSDCLSQEKREGTLGLLFLTDLRGFDVVGGKLLVTSLRGFYAVLAILPVLSTTVLLGGVTGTQVAYASLALLNSLFASLCSGLLVSALSRNGQKAMSATFVLVLLVNLGGPIADSLIHLNSGNRPTPGPMFSLCSPGFAFGEAMRFGAVFFWSALGVSHLTAWTFFGLASLILPRSWQERRASAGSTATGGWVQTWKYGKPGYRAKLRSRLLQPNPVVWLVCRERWQGSGIWILALAMAGLLVLFLFIAEDSSVWMVGSSFTTLGVFAVYIWCAAYSCRFPIEARRSGLLELLLAAPLEVRSIVWGQWLGFLRMFAAPLLLLILTLALFAGFAQQGTFAGVLMGGNSAVLPPWVLTVSLATASLVSTAANLAALVWFGLWMGLSSRNTNMAALKTLLFVQIIPAFVLGFASMFTTVLLMMPSAMASPNTTVMNPLWAIMVALLVPALLAVAKDVFFISWSRRKLYGAFREIASRPIGVFAPVPPVIPVAAPRVEARPSQP